MVNPSSQTYSAITVREVLALPTLAGVKLRVGEGGLDQPVEWCHAVDIPEVTQWVKPHELLLTTGYSWPTEDAALRELFLQFAQIGIAGIILAVPGYLGAFPTAALEVAQQHDLPLIESPWHIPFADINQAIQREIAFRQLTTLERLDHLHQTLTSAALSARELPDIVGRLEDLLGRSAEFQDLTGQRLAGRGVSDVTGSLSALVATADTSYGRLLLDPQPEAFSVIDQRGIELCATVCTLHMLRQSALAEAEARVQASFVDAILHGQPSQVSGFQERARLQGYDPQASHAVLIVALLGPDGSRWPLNDPDDVHRREQVARAVRWTFTEQRLPVWLTFDLNHVIALIPSQADSKLSELGTAVHAACQRFTPRQPVALGLGTVIAGENGAAQSLREAQIALLGVQEPGVWHFTDRPVDRILATASADAIAALQKNMLGKLRDTPELQQTLLSWASSGFSIEAASQQLGLHRNALSQRLKRIEKLTQLPLDDPDTRLALALVTRSLKLG